MEPHQQERLQELAKKWLDGTITPAEQEEYAAWYNNHENTDIHIPAEYAGNKDELRNRILQSIHASKETRPVNNFKRYMVAAAVIAGIVIGSTYLFNSSETTTTLAIADNKHITTAHVENILLPDSSVIITKPGSSIIYPEHFDKETREVTLIGEAYFDIKSNPDKPFIIHTGNVTTTVLGTAFSIKALENDKDVTVTVTRGKVKVEKNNKLMAVLTPNKRVICAVKSDAVQQTTVNSYEATKWISNDLSFEESSLKDVCATLELRFLIKFDFENESLKNCKVTASFAGTESLEKMMYVLSTVLHFKYNINDHTVKLSGTCK